MRYAIRALLRTPGFTAIAVLTLAIGIGTTTTIFAVIDALVFARARSGDGPDVYAVEVGTGGHDWSRFPLEPGPLQLHHNGPAGVRRITFEGDGAPFRLGDVAFEFSSAA